jgi:hypothetical protein
MASLNIIYSKNILFLMVVSLFGSLNAQSVAEKNSSKNIVSLGYGLYSIESDNWGGLKGPAMAKYEHRIGNHFGLGLNLSVGKTAVSAINKQQTWFFSALIRGNYYLEITQQLETYVGLGVGIRNTLPFQQAALKNIKSLESGLGIPNNKLGLEATVGLRYHFSPVFSAYTEAGFSKGLLQFGACYHW